MPYDRNDAPSVGGSHQFIAGKKVGEPGGKQTCKMQGVQGTGLPDGGAPRRSGNKGARGGRKMGKAY